MDAKKTALVTGATSGIGRAYADWFAKHGYDLVVTGRRTELLMELASELEARYGTITEVIEAELSLDKDIRKIEEAIKRRDDIHVLVNNAGYGCGVEFSKCGINDHMSMLHVHVETAVKLVYAVLPQMIGHKAGVIINVSSIGAYLPGPGSVMYSGTKLFLAGFSESLQMEVRQYGIKVQCLCPGMTRSDFHKRRKVGQGLNAANWMMMEPEILVEKSIRALHRKKIVIIPGLINKMLIIAVDLIPKRLYYLILEQSIKIKTNAGFFDRMKQLVEKAVSLFFPTHANQV